MKPHQISLLLAIAAGFASAITQVRAATIFYDQGLWQIGISVVSTVPFDNDLIGGQTNYTAAGLTESGVHFSSSELYVEPTAFYYLSPYLFDGSGLLTITLPTGTTAVGMNVISQTGGANLISLNAILTNSGTVSSSFSGVAYNPTFWGITSSDPISTITINASSTWLGLDNFSIGTVPEPSTCAKLAVGFGSLFIFRRRNQSAAL